MKLKKIIYLTSCFLISGFIVISINLQPTPADGAESDTFKFERMWPVLKQPWYFKYPQDIALDTNGNFYVIDLEIDRVQKFTSEGNFILQWGVRGFGEGEIFSPECVAVDKSGNVYVADSVNFRIQKFTPDGQYVMGWKADDSENQEYISFAGIDIDSSDMIYVTDNVNHNIQKYTIDGAFVAKWGSPGSGEGQLNSPGSIASDNNGNVYVVDAENHRIQKFTSDGIYVLQWGQKGEANNEFDFGSDGSATRGGISVSKEGFVYVSDTNNSCIKKFTSQGEFVAKYGIASWQYSGIEELIFSHPSGLDVDSSGYIYVNDVGNPGVTKFSDNQFIANWGGAGRETGSFDNPSGIALDKDGYVYICDTNNDRIQKFSSTGQFITTWGENGGAIGKFDNPAGIAADSNGNIYVTDADNSRIQKFTSDGSYLMQWGSEGGGHGEFSEPRGIALDGNGNIYVADTGNYRIQKFSSEGLYLSEWGSKGTGNGQFEYPVGIAADKDGKVYVADEDNDCIHKFTSEGVFITKFSGDFNTDEQLNDPSDVDIDNEGNVYVSDKWGTRILILTSKGELIEVLGAMGTDPGMFSLPVSIAVLPSGDRLYVGESPNNRIQVFSKGGQTQTDPTSGISKAIIVAGGGPYPGNTLWDSTQVCTNYAYRILTYQGFTKDNIYYLSSDSDLDLNGNGQFDDVDIDATNTNLEYAITNWAKDADDLLIYITDHGGDTTFRMSETQLLNVSDLDSWLDQVEATISGNISLIYDACQSGSFLSELSPVSGKDRILITSTMESESAYFTSMGSLSFSYFFWGNIFNGMSIGDSFIAAKNVIEYTYTNQTPLLDDTGNGIGNEDGDGAIAKITYVGNGIISASDMPVIETVSSDQRITNTGTSATIYADNVVDANGISRVWSVITPPDSANSNPWEPVLSLPILEMKSGGSGNYIGTYNDFSTNGIYNIAVFAEDSYGNISFPVRTTVTQTQYPNQITFKTNPEVSDISFTALFFDSQSTADWYQLWIGNASGNQGEYVDTSAFNTHGNGWISKNDLADLKVKNSYLVYSELWVGQYDSATKETTWSHGAVNFSNIITDDSPPSKVSQTSPSGTTQDSIPTCTWAEDQSSTWYKFWLGYPNGDKIFAKWYEAFEICSGNICVFTLESKLADGDYEWYIKSWNDYGKVWSDGMSFTVDN
jgi:sugar lactone lactonase YvrE